MCLVWGIPADGIAHDESFETSDPIASVVGAQ